MLEHILKSINAEPQNEESSRPSGQYGPFQKCQIISKFKQPNRQSSSGISYPQTPAFDESNLGWCREVPEPYYEASEKVSEVMSINDIGGEDCHPMILSNIHSPEQTTGVDKLTLLKMRNHLSQLRQAQLDLGQIVEQERLSFESFTLELAHQVKTIFLKKLSQNQESESLTIRSLQKKVTETQQSYHTALKKIQGLQEMLQTEKNKNMMINNVSISSEQCPDCKSLGGRVTALTDELAQGQHEIERLLIENQRLQQYIFDIEQKIVGIDLEVERKLKEKIKNMPQSHYDKVQLSINQDRAVTLEQQLRSLKANMKEVEQQCKHYEQRSLEVEKWKQRLLNKEKEMEHRQAVLREGQIRSEELKQVNYEREHQLLEAEEHLSKKITDLAQKEAELSSWEAELIRKASQPPRASQSQGGLPNNINSHEDLNHSREVSLRSFGKAPRQSDELYERKSSSRRNYTQQQIDRFNPRQELMRIQGNSNHDSRGILKGFDNKRHIETLPLGKDLPGRNMRVIASSYYNESREPSPYRALNEQRGRGQLRDVSKNSRSSAGKSLRGGYGLRSPSTRGRGEVQQISGISSKLERLREQLKKEIESIK